MFKKRDVFFETLQNMADTLVQAAETFAQGVENLQDVLAFTKEMKELESKCDVYTHTILTELNKVFITPIEREDIMALTTALDDVLDGMEASASRFDMYQLLERDEIVVLFADVIKRSTYEIQKAIRLLSEKKLLAIREHNIRVNELENAADDIYRRGIRALFADVTDPIELIKRKDIYERLEQTTDSCEDVANQLESIVMRNS
ncbi:DUF47 family protein [Paenibacillus thiaminolyticus]|uniref:DUF47 domain-containing protein n=1 Tax=Paenibacillus thiaminolyticus TaxID=49283 RepID=A0AAJ1LDC4_PANTH|nr:DUF47 family protein [Paenibacillus thiaminolyticus]MCY9535036.1 DUF47 family protein [Paenibacillus thiaminolyticus]MCY9605167.1 DUF47 family protein [Paenibacillus thiaminolyticus]MCY9606018.1 DUF47 family protein [Paenibacillus thiaminolyticus]MCY9615676.1 DUF47 family protein [Paenibacillus thiaminolyticus]MCY9620421.1 DUF47 family protein [Paenibacillus thiaminolyticus]